MPQQQPAVAEQHGEQDGDNQAACGNQPPEIFGQRAAAVGGEGEAVNQCGSECDEEYQVGISAAHGLTFADRQRFPAGVELPVFRRQGVDLEGFGQLVGAEAEADFGFDFAPVGVVQRAFGQDAPVGDGADAAKGCFEAAVFGGEGADGDAVAVGQRVKGELVGNAVVAADELAEFEFVGGHGGGGQLVVQGEVERHALFQRLLQRVGQFGVETAADVEAAVCGYGCGLAGDGNVFRRRFRRPQQYHGKQQDGRRRTGGTDDAAVCGFTAVCG